MLENIVLIALAVTVRQLLFKVCKVYHDNWQFADRPSHDQSSHGLLCSICRL